jgi:hypothetical protein
MPVNRKIMASLKEQYGEEKGEDIYYAMEQKGKIASADDFTDAIDRNKDCTNKKPPLKIFSSYWEEWLHTQRENKEDLEDLFLKWLSGRGDRPDIGAGLKRVGEFEPAEAVSSASASGAATTVSNLSEMGREHKDVKKL